MRWAWLTALVFICLPVLAEDAVPPTPPEAAVTGPKPKAIVPPTRRDIEQAINRGVAFLLKRQNKDGSWGSANITRPYEIDSPVPGAHQAFKAAVTSMCISALIEIGGDNPEVPRAIDRAEVWLFEHLPKVRRQTPDTFYNVWTHAYSIQALTRMLGRKPGDAERQQRIRALIDNQIDKLNRYEVVDGGWAYYDFDYHTQKPGGSSIGFLTSAVLVALHDAKLAGIDVPKRLVDRGTASILRQRKPDFSMDYGEYLKYQPQRLINRPSGSLGRSQACNIAMRLWGDKLVTDDVHEDVARSAVREKPMARHGPQTPDPARIVVSGGRLLLLFRPLLRRAVHRPASGEGAAVLPRSPGPYSASLAGEGRFVVGFPHVRLPPAVRNGVCADVACAHAENR